MTKRGFCIAFMGTDGSGKSTIINHVIPWLESRGMAAVHYEHLRPNCLPALGVVAGKRSKGDSEPVTNPHSQAAVGFVSSVVRLAYYWLDYFLGYYLKTWPIIKSKEQVCIFDRYFYDLLIDPRRMRIQLPIWIMRGAFLFVPKPDLVICLGADAEVLYERKPETSLEEVARQVNALRSLCASNSRAIWVDTGQSLNASVQETFTAIECLFSKRIV